MGQPDGIRVCRKCRRRKAPSGAEAVGGTNYERVGHAGMQAHGADGSNNSFGDGPLNRVLYQFAGTAERELLFDMRLIGLYGLHANV